MSSLLFLINTLLVNESQQFTAVNAAEYGSSLKHTETAGKVSEIYMDSDVQANDLFICLVCPNANKGIKRDVLYSFNGNYTDKGPSTGATSGEGGQKSQIFPWR